MSPAHQSFAAFIHLPLRYALRSALLALRFVATNMLAVSMLCLGVCDFKSIFDAYRYLIALCDALALQLHAKRK